MTTTNFAAMTSTELRKQASVLGISNYTKYKKDQLLIMIIEKTKPVEEVKPLITIVQEPLLLTEGKKIRKKRVFDDIPREGTQAREVYEMFKKHEGQSKWTVYRVAKELGASLNNTRRVYMKYFKK